MYLGKTIRYLRKQRDMSQEQLADAFGYDNYTTVQKWESDKSDPPLKIVRGLAELFGVGIDDIVKVDLEAIGWLPSLLPASLPAADASDLTSPEREHIRKYRALDENGREMVDAVLDTAFQQVSGAASASLGDAM